MLYIYFFLLSFLCFLTSNNLEGQKLINIQLIGSQKFNAAVNISGWNNGVESLFIRDSLINGKTEIKVPDTVKSCMLIAKFEGNVPLNNLKIIYNEENQNIIFKILQNNKVIVLGNNNGETEKYYTAKNLIDSITQRILNLRRVLIVYDPEDEFAINISKYLEKEINAINKIYDEQNKLYEGSIFLTYLNAGRYYAPAMLKNEDEMRKLLLQHFFDYFNPLDPLFMRSPVIDSKIEDYLSIAASNGDDIKREENIKRAIDNYMLKIISSDYVIKITANFMRKWLNKYGFESIVEYIDIQYLSAQCDAGEDFNLQERLQAYKRLAPGNIAPDITWLGADNNIYTLSNLKANKKVVIFWGTWCPNCEELLPKIYNYLQNKNNIKVIAIGLDEDEKQWEITIQKFVGWQHLRAPEKWQNDIVKLYGVVATPSIFIINSDNKIQKKVNNINDFINEIEKK